MVYSTNERIYISPSQNLFPKIGYWKKVELQCIKCGELYTEAFSQIKDEEGSWMRIPSHNTNPPDICISCKATIHVG